MAAYRIHVPLDDHVGQKTGLVRSCTRGTRIEAPEGEFADLTPGSQYSRLDNDRSTEDTGAEEKGASGSAASSSTDSDS